MTRGLWIVAALMSGLGGSVLADELPAVITNEYLEARYGGAQAAMGVSGSAMAAAAVSAAAIDPDPLQAIADARAREADRARRRVEARAEITRLEARVAELERRRLAVRNPLLPPPVVPDELRDEWDGWDSVQRDIRTTADLERARAALTAARAAESAIAREP